MIGHRYTHKITCMDLDPVAHNIVSTYSIAVDSQAIDGMIENAVSSSTIDNID